MIAGGVVPADEVRHFKKRHAAFAKDLVSRAGRDTGRIAPDALLMPVTGQLSYGPFGKSQDHGMEVALRSRSFDLRRDGSLSLNDRRGIFADHMAGPVEQIVNRIHFQADRSVLRSRPRLTIAIEGGDTLGARVDDVACIDHGTETMIEIGGVFHYGAQFAFEVYP